MNRRRYAVILRINGQLITEVEIDPHYEDKHPDISDEVILNLVKLLHGSISEPLRIHQGWMYYVDKKLKLNDKLYRLIWCIETENSHSIGVINCFRERK